MTIAQLPLSAETLDHWTQTLDSIEAKYPDVTSWDAAHLVDKSNRLELCESTDLRALIAQARIALILPEREAQARRDVLDEMFEAITTLPISELDQEMVADHLRAHLATPEASDE